MSLGYNEVSQLQTQIAILESQIDVKDVAIGLLKEEIQRLTNLVGTLFYREKWDGNDLGTKLEYKLEPRKKR